jgi:hypothetical protein
MIKKIVLIVLGVVMILFAFGLLYKVDECHDCPVFAMSIIALILFVVGGLLVVRPLENGT